MKLRSLAAWSVCLAGVGILAALPAFAAISVLGSGLGEACYKAAEFHLNPKDGLESCTAALEQQSLAGRDRGATYINRGILQMRVGNLDAALQDYDTGLEIDPTLAEGYVDRGVAYISMKRYKEALVDIDKGLSLGTERPHIAYFDRAIAHEALGDIKGAYLDYKHAIKLAPDFQPAIEQLKRFKVVRKPAANGS